MPRPRILSSYNYKRRNADSKSKDEIPVEIKMEVPKIENEEPDCEIIIIDDDDDDDVVEITDIKNVKITHDGGTKAPVTIEVRRENTVELVDTEELTSCMPLETKEAVTALCLNSSLSLQLVANKTSKNPHSTLDSPPNVVQFVPNSPTKVYHFISDSSDGLAQFVNNSSNRVLQLIPDSSARVAQLMPDSSPRVAQLVTDSSAKVAQLPTNSSTRLAQLSPSSSVRLAQSVPDSSAKVAQLPTNSSPRLAQSSPSSSVRLAQLVPDSSAKVAQLPTNSSMRLAQLSPSSSVRLAQSVPDSSAKVAQLPTNSSPRLAQLSPSSSARLAQLITNTSAQVMQLVPNASPKFAQLVPNTSAQSSKKITQLIQIAPATVSQLLSGSSPKLTQFSPNSSTNFAQLINNSSGMLTSQSSNDRNNTNVVMVTPVSSTDTQIFQTPTICTLEKIRDLNELTRIRQVVGVPRRNNSSISSENNVSPGLSPINAMKQINAAKRANEIRNINLHNLLRDNKIESPKRMTEIHHVPWSKEKTREEKFFAESQKTLVPVSHEKPVDTFGIAKRALSLAKKAATKGPQACVKLVDVRKMMNKPSVTTIEETKNSDTIEETVKSVNIDEKTRCKTIRTGKSKILMNRRKNAILAARMNKKGSKLSALARMQARLTKALSGMDHPMRNKWRAQCIICKSRFTDKYEFHRHATLSHPGVRIVFCELCSSSFRTDDELRQHRSSYHKITVIKDSEGNLTTIEPTQTKITMIDPVVKTENESQRSPRMLKKNLDVCRSTFNRKRMTNDKRVNYEPVAGHSRTSETLRARLTRKKITVSSVRGRNWKKFQQTGTTFNGSRNRRPQTKNKTTKTTYNYVDDDVIRYDSIATKNKFKCAEIRKLIVPLARLESHVFDKYLKKYHTSPVLNFTSMGSKDTQDLSGNNEKSLLSRDSKEISVESGSNRAKERSTSERRKTRGTRSKERENSIIQHESTIIDSSKEKENVVAKPRRSPRSQRANKFRRSESDEITDDEDSTKIHSLSDDNEERVKNGVSTRRGKTRNNRRTKFDLDIPVRQDFTFIEVDEDEKVAEILKEQRVIRKLVSKSSFMSSSTLENNRYKNDANTMSILDTEDADTETSYSLLRNFSNYTSSDEDPLSVCTRPKKLQYTQQTYNSDEESSREYVTFEDTGDFPSNGSEPSTSEELTLSQRVELLQSELLGANSSKSLNNEERTNSNRVKSERTRYSLRNKLAESDSAKNSNVPPKCDGDETPKKDKNVEDKRKEGKNAIENEEIKETNVDENKRTKEKIDGEKNEQNKKINDDGKEAKENSNGVEKGQKEKTDAEGIQANEKSDCEENKLKEKSDSEENKSKEKSDGEKNQSMEKSDDEENQSIEKSDREENQSNEKSDGEENQSNEKSDGEENQSKEKSNVEKNKSIEKSDREEKKSKEKSNGERKRTKEKSDVEEKKSKENDDCEGKKLKEKDGEGKKLNEKDGEGKKLNEKSNTEGKQTKENTDGEGKQSKEKSDGEGKQSNGKSDGEGKQSREKSDTEGKKSKEKSDGEGKQSNEKCNDEEKRSRENDDGEGKKSKKKSDDEGKKSKEKSDDEEKRSKENNNGEEKKSNEKSDGEEKQSKEKSKDVEKRPTEKTDNGEKIDEEDKEPKEKSDDEENQSKEKSDDEENQSKEKSNDEENQSKENPVVVEQQTKKKTNDENKQPDERINDEDKESKEKIDDQDKVTSKKPDDKIKETKEKIKIVNKKSKQKLNNDKKNSKEKINNNGKMQLRDRNKINNKTQSKDKNNRKNKKTSKDTSNVDDKKRTREKNNGDAKKLREKQESSAKQTQTLSRDTLKSKVRKTYSFRKNPSRVAKNLKKPSQQNKIDEFTESQDSCNVCKELFALMTKISDQVGERNNADKPIKCPLCQRYFIDIFHLQLHVSTNHLRCQNRENCKNSQLTITEKLSQNPVVIDCQTELEMAIECSRCTLRFNAEKDLNDHLINQHETPTMKDNNASSNESPEYLEDLRTSCFQTIVDENVCSISRQSNESYDTMVNAKLDNSTSEIDKDTVPTLDCSLCEAKFFKITEYVCHVRQRHHTFKRTSLSSSDRTSNSMKSPKITDTKFLEDEDSSHDVSRKLDNDEIYRTSKINPTDQMTADREYLLKQLLSDDSSDDDDDEDENKKRSKTNASCQRETTKRQFQEITRKDKTDETVQNTVVGFLSTHHTCKICQKTFARANDLLIHGLDHAENDISATTDEKMENLDKEKSNDRQELFADSMFDIDEENNEDFANTPYEEFDPTNDEDTSSVVNDCNEGSEKVLLGTKRRATSSAFDESSKISRLEDKVIGSKKRKTRDKKRSWMNKSVDTTKQQDDGKMDTMKELMETEMVMVDETNDKLSIACDKCNRHFANRSLLNEHLFFLHDDTLKDTVLTDILTPSTTNEDNETSRRLQCQTCSQNFKLFQGYSRHRYFAHGDDSMVHVCENCSKVLTNVTMVNVHICMDMASYNCRTCNVTFSTGMSLRLHNTEKHIETKGPHVCEPCEKQFLTRAMLERHVNGKHRLIRPYRERKNSPIRMATKNDELQTIVTNENVTSDKREDICDKNDDRTIDSAATTTEPVATRRGRWRSCRDKTIKKNEIKVERKKPSNVTQRPPVKRKPGRPRKRPLTDDEISPYQTSEEDEKEETEKEKEKEKEKDKEEEKEKDKEEEKEKEKNNVTIEEPDVRRETTLYVDETEIHQCSMCQLYCLSKSALRSHMAKIHSINDEFCQLCQKIYPNGKIIRHMIDKHIASDDFNVMRYERSWQIGTNSNEIDTEIIVKMLGIKRLVSLCEYRRYTECNDLESYKCPYCVKTFPSNELYRYHFLLIHDEICVLCNTTYKKGHDAARHKGDIHGSVGRYIWFADRTVMALMSTKNFAKVAESIFIEMLMKDDRFDDETREEFDDETREKFDEETKEEFDDVTNEEIDDMLEQDEDDDETDLEDLDCTEILIYSTVEENVGTIMHEMETSHEEAINLREEIVETFVREEEINQGERRLVEDTSLSKENVDAMTNEEETRLVEDTSLSKENVDAMMNEEETRQLEDSTFSDEIVDNFDNEKKTASKITSKTRRSQEKDENLSLKSISRRTSEMETMEDDASIVSDDFAEPEDVHIMIVVTDEDLERFNISTRYPNIWGLAAKISSTYDGITPKEVKEMLEPYFERQEDFDT